MNLSTKCKLLPLILQQNPSLEVYEITRSVANDAIKPNNDLKPDSKTIENKKHLSESDDDDEIINPLAVCAVTMEDDNYFQRTNLDKRISALPENQRESVTVRRLIPSTDFNGNETTDGKNRVKTVRKKKYVCQFCHKKFGWSTDLKRHILIHTGERPFKCDTCSATFTRNFLLQKHHSKIHHRRKDS